MKTLMLIVIMCSLSGCGLLTANPGRYTYPYPDPHPCVYPCESTDDTAHTNTGHRVYRVKDAD